MDDFVNGGAFDPFSGEPTGSEVGVSLREIFEISRIAIAVVKLPRRHSETRKLSYRKDDRAMRPMYGRPENFQESLTTHTATFPEFLMGFCSD